MKDTSDIIVTLVLVLLIGIAWLGYSGDLDQRLEREMSYHQESWKRAREVNKQLECFRLGYAELYLIDYELKTGRAETAFTECTKKALR